MNEPSLEELYHAADEARKRASFEEGQLKYRFSFQSIAKRRDKRMAGMNYGGTIEWYIDHYMAVRGDFKEVVSEQSMKVYYSCVGLDFGTCLRNPTMRTCMAMHFEREYGRTCDGAGNWKKTVVGDAVVKHKEAVKALRMAGKTLAKAKKKEQMKKNLTRAD